MPRFRWHLYKRQHDMDANSLLSLNAPNFLDWEAITLFYSAMHYVDSAICKIRLAGVPIPEPHNHKQRRKLVTKYLSGIATEYGMLEAISQWARYQEVTITAQISKAATTLYSDVISYIQSNFP